MHKIYWVCWNYENHIENVWKGEIEVGNCGNFGYVVAKLNGKQVGRVDGYQSKTLELDFKDGDILEISDNDDWDVTGTIELSSLDIISCSTC